MYILIDLIKKQSFVATGVKQLSIGSGFNFHTLVSYMRDKNYHINNKLIISRVDEPIKMNRGKHMKGKNNFVHSTLGK